jgi:hypothetical protein
MENEIINWLESERDYATGRALFEKYSRKKPLKNLFRRKYKPDVLLYNLQKLCKFPGKAVKEKQTGTVGTVGTVGTSVTGRKTIVTDKVNYEDLPDHLQKVYDQNKELYKHMRAYHEKMKQATTDEDRAKYRKILAEYDDEISGNWKQIDSWDGRMQDIEATGTDPEKEVAAARKFLSVNIKYVSLREGVKQQLLLFAIREKIDILKKYKVKIPKATVAELEKFGVNI